MVTGSQSRVWSGPKLCMYIDVSIALAIDIDYPN